MRRRRLACLALAADRPVLTACDTDDGREMQTPDSYARFQLQNTTTSTSTTVAPPPDRVHPGDDVDDARRPRRPPARRRRPRRRVRRPASTRGRQRSRRARRPSAPTAADSQFAGPWDDGRGDPRRVHVRRRRRRPADHVDGAARRAPPSWRCPSSTPTPTASCTGSSSACRPRPDRSAVASRSSTERPRRPTPSASSAGAARAHPRWRTAHLPVHAAPARPGDRAAGRHTDQRAGRGDRGGDGEQRHVHRHLRARLTSMSLPPPTGLPQPPAAERTFCYRHPNREAGRRCTRCGRPACTECLVRADIGSQCVECARRADRPRAPAPATGAPASRPSSPTR